MLPSGLETSEMAWFVLGWFFLALWLGLVASLGLWVYRDARARGSDSPVGWAISVGFLVIPMLPWYLYRRRSLDGRHGADSTFDRLLRTWVTAGLTTFVVGSVVAPPDPFAHLIYWSAMLPVTLPLAYVFVSMGGFEWIRRWLGRGDRETK